MIWTYKITWQGAGALDSRTQSFDLGDHTTVELAEAAAGAIKSALVAASKAYVSRETLTATISEDNQVPTDKSADTYEELAMACYLNPVTEKQKLFVLSVVAPEDSMFLPGGQTLDVTNSLARAVADAVEANAYVSDGEQLQSDGRTNGAIESGWLRSKAKSFKAK